MMIAPALRSVAAASHHGVHRLPNDGVPAPEMAVLLRPRAVRRIANGADEGPLLAVDPAVNLHVMFNRKRLETHIAFKGPLPAMHSAVVVEAVFLFKGLGALRALKGSLPGMRPNVGPAVPSVGELLSAVRTARETGPAAPRMHRLLMATQLIQRFEVLSAVRAVARPRLLTAERRESSGARGACGASGASGGALCSRIQRIRCRRLRHRRQ